MTSDPELHGLVGIPIMTAISILSTMGFRCKDISKQVVFPSLRPAGTFSCIAIKSSGLTNKVISITIPFSEKGIVMEIIKNESSDHF